MKKEVRAVNHLARLLGNRTGEAFVPMAERADADAGEQIEIFTSLGVVHAHTLTAYEHDGCAAVGLDDVLRLEFADVLHLRYLSRDVSASRRRTLSNARALAGSGRAAMPSEHGETGQIVSVGHEHFARSVLYCAAARRELCDHASGCAAAADQRVDVAEGHVGNRGAIALEDPRRCPGDNQPRRFQPACEVCG